MKYFSVVAFVLFVAGPLLNIQALECGIESRQKQNDLRKIAENCMAKKVEEKEEPVSEDDEEDVKETTTEAFKNMNKRNKRSDNNEQKKNESEKNENNNGTTSNKNNCVVQCIFNQLAMTDSNGFPEHHKVSQALLKNANGRELRDFVQDTTDECFQLMEQGEHQEPCLYSVTLVNCLAERGKANCADWPIGNLPFLSKH